MSAKILTVDDSASIRLTTNVALSGAGYAVTEAVNGAEGIANVTMLSCFRARDFLHSFGVAMESGPLAGLAARAVVVLDDSDKVLYCQLVPEVTDEPDYAAALAALG